METLPDRQKNNQPENGLVLSENTKAIITQVAEVNELVVFKLENEVILHWAQEVERLVPGTTPEKLRFLMDCFKTEQLVWDNKKGIQNILVSLKYIREKEGGGYKLLNWPV